MIEVIKQGQYTTIQDLGRYGFRSIGVPVSGPMDKYSARLANELIGNNANAPVLEMTLTGCTLLFKEATQITVTGAECRIQDGEIPIETNKIVKIDAGTELKFGAVTNGNFVYLAVKGGFKSKTILGSVSYCKGITEKTRIQKGQILEFNPIKVKFGLPEIEVSKRKISASIQVEKGPEFDLLSEPTKQGLTESMFTISMQSNRMGFRLTGGDNLEAKEIITSPVQAGTVQLTPSGQLIVLMRDAQTTGGYSRVFQLTPSSLDQLSQIRFGGSFKFKLID